jgi:hypothetical protein
MSSDAAFPHVDQLVGRHFPKHENRELFWRSREEFWPDQGVPPSDPVLSEDSLGLGSDLPLVEGREREITPGALWASQQKLRGPASEWSWGLWNRFRSQAFGASDGNLQH